MHCPKCASMMQSHSSQTIKEEQGAMVLTSWWCKPCDQTYEEISACQGYQGMQRRRLLYPVRSIQLPVHLPTRHPGKTRRIQAHALVG